MNYKDTSNNHPIKDSPYRLHLFHKNEFLNLSKCCANMAHLKVSDLYITAYNPFLNTHTDFDIYTCQKCGNMYITTDGKYRKIENLLKYQVKQRKEHDKT